jgi:hypothetical protein
VSRDGWDAFTRVTYKGGDSTQSKRREGVIVLTEAGVGFHPCRYIAGCNTGKESPFLKTPYFVIPYTAITTLVSNSIEE